jgi:GT2 family glycosyltransferase
VTASSAAAPPRVFILLPVHNRRQVTEKFIHCLLSQTYPNWHLVLIDDGSRDGTAQMAQSLTDSLTILQGQGTWWWGGALHQGYKWLQEGHGAPQDVVLIANDDTVFDTDFLASGVAAMKSRSLLLAQLYDMDRKFAEAGVHWDWRTFECTAVTDEKDINCFSTRGLFLTVGDFMEIGGFYPRLLPHYLSDYEFTTRAYRRGFALITASSVHLRFDETLTGIRKIEGHSFRRSMQMTFSTRAAGNPVYWTSFALLSGPPRYRLLNALRVWWRFTSPLRIKIMRALLPARYFLGRVKRKLLRLCATKIS